MHSIPYKTVAVLLLLAGLVYGLLRWWQGPQVQGYELDLMPLLQTGGAAGRIVTESRTQVGSKITGVVLERRVLADATTSINEGARVRFTARSAPVAGSTVDSSRNELPVSFD